ncbi:MAG: TRAP transporter solute receptor, unknown substrate 6, partial [uncultured Acetobacteraceae bacterium]
APPPRPGRRRRAGRARRPRPRADPQPGDPLAPDQQLPPQHRHHLRRGGEHGQARGAADRQQVPDPLLPGRRDRAGVPGAGRGAGRHPRMRPDLHPVLHRQGALLRLLLQPALRPHHPADDRLDAARRRQGGGRRALRRLQHRRPGRGRHRRADGRLVPPRGEERRRPPGAQVPRVRLRRQHVPADGRLAHPDRPRRHLPGAGARRDRRRRVHRPLRRREARLRPGRALLLRAGLLGGELARRADGEPPRLGRAAGALPGGAGAGRVRPRGRDAVALRRPEPQGAAAAGRGRRAAAHLAAGGDAGRLAGGARALRRDGGQGRAVPPHLRELARLPRRAVPVVQGGGAHLRKLRLRRGRAV